MTHEIELVVFVTRDRLVRNPFRKCQKLKIEGILLLQCVECNASKPYVVSPGVFIAAHAAQRLS